MVFLNLKSYRLVVCMLELLRIGRQGFYRFRLWWWLVLLDGGGGDGRWWVVVNDGWWF